MTRRTPPPELTDSERAAWREAYKNRNRHSVKLTDALEQDFQAFRTSRKLTDNAAINLLLSTHPELK